MTLVEEKAAPTARELVDRVRALRPMLRAQQDDAEQRGHYGEEVHRALVDADLYRLLTPRRYGGLEVDLSTYARLVIEVSRGDPSTGWCYGLGHNHNLTTASHWGREAQDEVFAAPGGYYRASHSIAGAGRAVRVDGGYRVSARSPYQSGVPWSTHSTVNAVVEGETRPDGSPLLIAAIVPHAEVTVLDDWGGDRTLGLRGSGSNTVVVSDVVVPEHRVCRFDWITHDYTGPSVGTELHGNPLYLGPVAGFLHMSLASPVVGAAKAALDEYEQIIDSRTSPFPPFQPRREDPLHQLDLGTAMTMVDAAEAIVVRCGDLYMEYAADAVERGVPFTLEMDARLYGMAQRASELASEAVGVLFRSAGSSAAMAGHPMQRYYRDVAMVRTHLSSQYSWTAMKIAQVHLGLRVGPY
ncbi:acyl-CoA dehydrogenase family protein [Modestobacter versicolor]|uniref:acyl-CoA dehydrogenase family protein n=1 Tax=Modestobacter versicolor TaxID=429133 RepID=UPI0034E038E2